MEPIDPERFSCELSLESWKKTEMAASAVLVVAAAGEAEAVPFCIASLALSHLQYFK